MRSRVRIEDAAPMIGRGCYADDVRAGHGDAAARRSIRSGILCAARGPRRKGRGRSEIRYPDLERAFDEVARRTAKKFLNDSEDATLIICIGLGGIAATARVIRMNSTAVSRRFARSVHVSSREVE